MGERLLKEDYEEDEDRPSKENDHMMLTESLPVEILRVVPEIVFVDFSSQNVRVGEHDEAKAHVNNNSPRHQFDGGSAEVMGIGGRKSEVPKDEHFVYPVSEENADDANQVQDW